MTIKKFRLDVLREKRCAKGGWLPFDHSRLKRELLLWFPIEWYLYKFYTTPYHKNFIWLQWANCITYSTYPEAVRDCFKPEGIDIICQQSAYSNFLTCIAYSFAPGTGGSVKTGSIVICPSDYLVKNIAISQFWSEIFGQKGGVVAGCPLITF